MREQQASDIPHISHGRRMGDICSFASFLFPIVLDRPFDDGDARFLCRLRSPAGLSDIAIPAIWADAHHVNDPTSATGLPSSKNPTSWDDLDDFLTGEKPLPVGRDRWRELPRIQ
jgi:hypothetical protein